MVLQSLCQSLVLACLFTMSVLMHILSCSLYNNWLPITMSAQSGAQHHEPMLPPTRLLMLLSPRLSHCLRDRAGAALLLLPE